ncbi:MAG: NAD(P)H-hydrate epimerase [Candidatus Bipolaricaulia bacterium]
MNKNISTLTTEQMVEVDRLMIEDYGIDLVRMMENAGHNLATLGKRLLGGSVVGKQIAVGTGMGNNGGGGLVAARHLSNWGADMTVVLAGPPEKFKAVPQEQLAILNHLPVTVEIADEQGDISAFREAGLIIDAVIGYGLKGAPRGVPGRLIAQIDASDAIILSLDAPSGLDTTTGRLFSPGVRATATLTLALPKTGLVTLEAGKSVGDLYLADIGVPPNLYTHLGLDVGPLFDEDTIIKIS